MNLGGIALIKENVSHELTAVLAHEIKNPISLIKANIELLELEGSFNGHQRNITIIRNELDKINTIISDFTFLCRPSNIENLREINLLNLIKNIMERYMVSCNDSNIQFHINSLCDVQAMTILGDFYKIDSMISNIYKNAIEELDGKIGIIETSINMANSRVIVEISDNGDGINDDILGVICNPFVTNKSYGTGLGLPICQNIMNELNGEFKIFNNDDRGCTVRMVF